MRKIYVLLVLLAGANCVFAQDSKQPKEIFASIASDTDESKDAVHLHPKKEFTLTPDSVPGSFILRSTTALENAKVCVYDILGNCIDHYAVSGKIDREINISGRPVGTYFVHIFSDEKKEVSLRIDMK